MLTRTVGCISCVSKIINQVVGTNANNYSVMRNIYIDSDGSKTKNGSEVNYTASPSNISIDGAGATFNNGAYTFGNLTAGTHTVEYLNKPAGYSMRHPTSSVPPSFFITLGPGCTGSPPPAGNCDAGNNIINLNFGISNSTAWIQGYDLDMRFDNGFSNTAPVGQYTLTTDSSGTTPGIMFTGNVSADFGNGQASITNKVVGGNVYPEVVG